MTRRVVVTGVGLVTPLGTGVEKSWKNICSGVSGVDLITRFDTSDYAVKIAAEVKDFKAEDFFEKEIPDKKRLVDLERIAFTFFLFHVLEKLSKGLGKILVENRIFLHRDVEFRVAHGKQFHEERTAARIPFGVPLRQCSPIQIVRGH